MVKKALVLMLAGLFLSLSWAAFAAETVKLSSTIGPVDSGLLPLLTKTYEEKTGVKVTYEAAGTGATLEKAKGGGFDMVVVHARSLEDKFIADGFGMDRRDLFYNDFVILGPKDDPAKIKGMKDAAEAFAKLAKAKKLFITRGDMSGTHVKELEVWEKAGVKIDPAKDTWYLEYSLGKLGNGPTTVFADKRGAYLLMDRTTYLIHRNRISLVPLVERDEILLNLVASLQMNPAKFPDANHAGAKAFIDWLCGDEAQTIIRDFQADKYGEPLFFPNSAEWNAKHKK